MITRGKYNQRVRTSIIVGYRLHTVNVLLRSKLVNYAFIIDIETGTKIIALKNLFDGHSTTFKTQQQSRMYIRSYVQIIFNKSLGTFGSNRIRRFAINKVIRFDTVEEKKREEESFLSIEFIKKSILYSKRVETFVRF